MNNKVFSTALTGSDQSKNILLSYWPVSSLFFLILLAGFLSFSCVDASAQGNLLITPRRVVFEGPKKSMDLNLANTGEDTATYAISMVQIRMKDDGGFETITKPDSGQRFADSHIRFFPRSVTLGPNEAQVVKVQIIKSGDLTEGEYRSHFYFRAVPHIKPRGEEETNVDTTTISVKLTPIFGITIPVIIRVGEYNANITLSEVNFQTVNDTIPRLSLTMNRTGTMSIYGELAVDHISPVGKITRVGVANGVAVYTPNTFRRFKLDLNKNKDVDFKVGKLRVTFTASSDVKQSRYAVTEVFLQK